MKTNVTKSIVKWMGAWMMAPLFLLLINSQAIAQHHQPPPPPHFGWIDSAQITNWFDSLKNWIDTGHITPPPPHDSGWTWNDSGHTPPPPPPPPHDTIHFPPPPPPPHDSGWTWNDSGHIPPPPPPPPNDSGWWDTLHFPPPPPPPPHDSGGICGDTIIIGHDTVIVDCGGHRIANPNSAKAAIITVYPNPVTEYATMHIENTSCNVLFRMFDMNGRLAAERTYTNGDFQINRADFSAGLYYYQILDGNTKLANGKLIFQ